MTAVHAAAATLVLSTAAGLTGDRQGSAGGSVSHRGAQQLLQANALAFRADRLLRASNQQLELLMTVDTAIFIEWHGILVALRHVLF